MVSVILDNIAAGDTTEQIVTTFRASCCGYCVSARPQPMAGRIHEEAHMKKQRRTKLIHEGQYLDEVDVELQPGGLGGISFDGRRIRSSSSSNHSRRCSEDRRRRRPRFRPHLGRLRTPSRPARLFCTSQHRRSVVYEEIMKRDKDDMPSEYKRSALQN